MYGLFLDVLILYGGIMTKRIPVGDFLWVQNSLNEILEESSDSKRGFFVMVDLEYPKSLHDDDFPLVIEIY